MGRQRFRGAEGAAVGMESDLHDGDVVVDAGIPARRSFIGDRSGPGPRTHHHGYGPVKIVVASLRVVHWSTMSSDTAKESKLGVA